MPCHVRKALKLAKITRQNVILNPSALLTLHNVHAPLENALIGGQKCVESAMCECNI